MTNHPPPPQHSDQTSPNKFGEGQGEQYITKAWDVLAHSQCLVELLKRLEVMKVGLNEVEAFCSGLNIKFRSKAFRDKGAKATRGVAAVVMKTKISDEVSKLGELTRERDNIRRDIKSEFGPKSVTTKAILKQLRINAQKVRGEFRKKYDIKAWHLNRKHEARMNPMACVPPDITEYANAKVYDRIKFDNIQVEPIGMSKVGKIDLKGNESEVLRLHPKFAIRVLH